MVVNGRDRDQRTSGVVGTGNGKLEVLGLHQLWGDIVEVERVHLPQLLTNALEHVVVQVPGLRDLLLIAGSFEDLAVLARVLQLFEVSLKNGHKLGLSNHPTWLNDCSLRVLWPCSILLCSGRRVFIISSTFLS